MKKSTLHILYIKKINEDYNSKTKKKQKNFQNINYLNILLKKLTTCFVCIYHVYFKSNLKKIFFFFSF